MASIFIRCPDKGDAYCRGTGSIGLTMNFSVTYDYIPAPVDPEENGGGSGGSPNSVPEPSVIGFVGLGLIGAGAISRRRKSNFTF